MTNSKNKKTVLVGSTKEKLSATNLYVVRKFIMAKSIDDAIKKEKLIGPDEVWLDEGFKNKLIDRLFTPVSKIGFNAD